MRNESREGLFHRGPDPNSSCAFYAITRQEGKSNFRGNFHTRTAKNARCRSFLSTQRLKNLEILPRGTFSSFCIHAIRVCMYCINAHVSWQFSTNGYYFQLASRHLWFHEFSPGEFTLNRREITRIWKIPRRNWKLPLFRLPPREFVSKRRRKTQRSIWCARVRWQFLNLAGQTRGKWSDTMINLVWRSVFSDKLA